LAGDNPKVKSGLAGFDAENTKAKKTRGVLGAMFCQ